MGGREESEARVQDGGWVASGFRAPTTESSFGPVGLCYESAKEQFFSGNESANSTLRLFTLFCSTGMGWEPLLTWNLVGQDKKIILLTLCNEPMFPCRPTIILVEN